MREQKNFYIVILLLICSMSYSQSKYGNVWVLGITNQEQNIKGGSLLDFNDDSLSVSYLDKHMDMRGSNTSVCNTDGELMFYTNGCYVANAEHKIIKGGDSVMPGLWTEFEYCDRGGYTASNSSLALPAPCSENAYYLFMLDFYIDVTDTTSFIHSSGLLYNLIDMDLDEGKGEVIINNEFVFSDTLRRGELAATRHVNGRDWWIVVSKRNTDCFFTILLNENGPQEPVRHCTGQLWDHDSGVMKFSPDGKYLVLSKFQNGMFVHRFDNATGAIVFEEKFQFTGENFPISAGLAISPNSRFVYQSGNRKLFQYDLQADNIGLSKITVAEWDGFMNPQITNFLLSHLGPDGKIYICSFQSTYNLHVIEKPDKRGVACEVKQHHIELPSLNSVSIPNMPYYGSEPDNSPCDSLLLLDTVDDLSESEYHLVYPNPTSDYLTIELENGDKLVYMEIRDMNGKLIQAMKRAPYGNTVELDISDIDKGMYMVVVYTSRMILSRKFIKQ